MDRQQVKGALVTESVISELKTGDGLIEYLQFLQFREADTQASFGVCGEFGMSEWTIRLHLPIGLSQYDVNE